MIAYTNTSFEAVASNAPAGLIGTITVGVYDPTTGGVILAARTTGITEPAPGTYVAQLVCPTAGTYLIRWSTPTGTAEEPLTVASSVTAYDWTPTVAEVSVLMYDRLIREGGASAPEFDDTTTPTGEQVSALIDLACIDLAGRVGCLVPLACVPQARYLAAVNAALLVEMAFAPEQTDNSASFDALNVLFNTRFEDFATRCRVPEYVPVV